MPSVNMIAARRAEKKRVERLIYITLLVIIGELAITLGVVGFMTARIHADNTRIRQLDEQMECIQPTVEKIRGYEAEIKELEPRLELLSQSRKRTLLWYRVLQDLSRSMPEKTWLTSVATTVPAAASDSSGGTSKPDQMPALNLAGSSVSQRLVGETMLRLNQCSEFERVDLSYTQENSGTGKEWLQFQIAAKLRSDEPKKGGAIRNVPD